MGSQQPWRLKATGGRDAGRLAGGNTRWYSACRPPVQAPERGTSGAPECPRGHLCRLHLPEVDARLAETRQDDDSPRTVAAGIIPAGDESSLRRKNAQAGHGATLRDLAPPSGLGPSVEFSCLSQPHRWPADVQQHHDGLGPSAAHRRLRQRIATPRGDGKQALAHVSVASIGPLKWPRTTVDPLCLLMLAMPVA